MSDKFGDNLTWMLSDISNADEDQIESPFTDIYGETEQGADCSVEVDIRELCGAAAERIASLEAQLKGREWISVADELPPKSTAFSTHSVLLWDSHQPVYPYTTGHGVMTGNNGVNIPYTISHYVDDRGNHLRPTHWMPLPSPPVKEQGQ